MYLPSSITVRYGAFTFARGASRGRDVLGGLDQRDARSSMFSAGPTLVPGLPFARMACTASPWARTAWCRTWLSSPGGSFRPGAIECHRPAADIDLHAVMAQVHERAELVDREEVPHAVAELLGDVAGVVPECLGRVARLPAAALSCSACGRSQW